MLEVFIPGKQAFQFRRLVLDLNGTITLDGEIINGVAGRIAELANNLDIRFITADTLGSAHKIEGILGIRMHRITPGEEQEQKLKFVQSADPNSTIAIGNGTNDALMLKEAALGICVIGPEGASTEAIQNADIVTTDINTALDLILKPKRLIATLRS